MGATKTHGMQVKLTAERWSKLRITDIPWSATNGEGQSNEKREQLIGQERRRVKKMDGMMGMMGGRLGRVLTGGGQLHAR